MANGKFSETCDNGENETGTGLLREKQAARLLNVSVRCLQRWRRLRQGPRFVRLGWTVRYRPADITAFVAQGAVDTAALSRGVSDDQYAAIIEGLEAENVRLHERLQR